MTTDSLAEPVTAPASPRLGDLIDQRAALYAEIKTAEKELNAKKERLDGYDDAILEMLDESGQTSGGGRNASMSIKESTVFSSKDWEATYEYIKANDAFHLLNRALNMAACRELFERNGSIPGVEPFNKRSLTFKSK